MSSRYPSSGYGPMLIAEIERRQHLDPDSDWSDVRAGLAELLAHAELIERFEEDYSRGPR